MDKVPRNARPKLSVAPIFEYSLRAPAPGVKIFGLRRRASQGMVFPAAQISKAAGASVTRGRQYSILRHRLQYVSRCNESLHSFLLWSLEASVRPAHGTRRTALARAGRPCRVRLGGIRYAPRNTIQFQQTNPILVVQIFLFSIKAGEEKSGVDNHRGVRSV
jgi:hypothetical protein